MFKKLLATAILVCSIPVLANAAWQFTTQVKTQGGTISTPKLAGQTVNQSTVYKSYTTHTQVQAISVDALPGWTISKIVQDGVTILNPTSPYTSSVNGGAGANASHSLSATFLATKLTVVASVTNPAGGSVSPTTVGNVFPGTQYAKLIFKFMPKAGYNVASIANVDPAWPITAGSSPTPITLPAAVGQTVTVTIPVGTVLSSGVNLVGTFDTSAPRANAGLDQTVAPSTLVNLSGTGQFGVFSKWSSASRPAGAAAIATVTGAFASPFDTSFTPTVEGTYSFVYRIANGNTTERDSVNVIVTTVAPLAGAAKARNDCIGCHNSQNVGGAGKAETVLANWSASGHKANAHGPQTCDRCHAGANAGAHPGSLACASCHGATVNHTAKPGMNATGTDCGVCHKGADATNGFDAHALEEGCIDCHSVQLNAGAGFVQDNAGVRSIMGEFTKRSHHITGATPTNAQCIVCHMEGKGTPYGVHIDSTYHMKDNKIYLRDADTNTAIVWSGTEHSNMDNFCFSCHDANGFAGVAAFNTPAIPGFTGTASNPFGDTLTNGYDLVARAGVVDVKTAFTTTNASHHAVSGQRYKYRFSTVANAQAWATRTGNPMPAASEIAVGNLDLDGDPIEFTEGHENYDPAGPEKGGHATLYEGDKFVASYIPLGASANVADNSLLHCGDCHTVGQWKAGSSTNADGSVTTVAIGAHGSANDYLLRNSLGTDALHNGLTYVCFNCHQTGTQASTPAAWAEQVAELLIADSVAPVSGSALNPLGKYVPAPIPTWKAGWGALHPTVYPGQLNGYATAHAVSAFHAQCQADSTEAITSVPGKGFNNFSSNRLQRSWSPQAVKAYEYVPASGATATAPVGGSNAASGNITGIACTNCHNSGLRNGWGGIHGGDNTYTDGLGRTQKSYRFMPGMGNYRYAPPGGWDGEDVSDSTLLTINNPLYPGTPGNRNDQSVGFPGASGKPMGGCYTNGGSTQAGDLNNTGGVTYGVCNHHGTSTAAPVGNPATMPASFRATYGGGSTGNPTTFEPTVREATSGGTLITRPLKY